VGNFSFDHSEINAFDLSTGAFIGSIPIDDLGQPGGLWALIFGGGGNNGHPNTLYFTDGLKGETEGLFAALTPSVPEPSTWAMLLVGLAGLGLVARRRTPLAIV
jgi:PEP-CTERM motif